MRWLLHRMNLSASSAMAEIIVTNYDKRLDIDLRLAFLSPSFSLFISSTFAIIL
jgi:hypothetical protein